MGLRVDERGGVLGLDFAGWARPLLGMRRVYGPIKLTTRVCEG